MEMDLSEGNFALRLYKSLKPVRGPRDELDPWPSLLSRNLYSHTAPYWRKYENKTPQKTEVKTSSFRGV
jgi:hypothetical protein